MTKCINCNIEVKEGDFCPECGMFCKDEKTESVEVNATPSPDAGTFLNKYTIERELSTGTIKQYLASRGEEKYQIEVKAVEKTADRDGSDSPATLKQEYELLRQIGPEKAIKPVEYAEDITNEYLVTESYKGNRLCDNITNKGMPALIAAGIILDLCDAVEKMHESGYAHLDITPENIMLQDNKAKLILTSRFSRLDVSRKSFLTTDGYSAPELYTNEPVIVSRNIDIFSLGAVFFTCLTGEKLPLGRIPSEILETVAEPELIRVIRRSCATHPELRFSSTSELKENLVAYIEKAGTDIISDAAVISDIGMVRANNEDCGLISGETGWRESKKNSWSLYLVADGMGGEQAGEVASSKALEEIRNFIYPHMSAPSANYDQVIKNAINQANNKIYLLTQENPSQSSMGTTVTLGLRIGHDLYIGHVGDSRAYLIRDGEIRQITEDHSLVANMVKAGTITSKEAKVHPDRNKIYRCLGNSKDVFIDILKEGKITLQPGDSLVFCTDGLTGHVDDEEILQSITGTDKADDACTGLVRMANTRGGEDNITVIIAKFK
jgi:protein phosphatase